MSGSMAPIAADRPSALLVVVAACALIDINGRVLIAKRPQIKSMAGLWEFPGGKVESGERPEETVIREMREELGIDIQESSLTPFIFASHGYPDFHLLMPLFLCLRWEGVPRAREEQEIAWVKPEDLARYPMPPADVPLISRLRGFINQD